MGERQWEISLVNCTVGRRTVERNVPSAQLYRAWVNAQARSIAGVPGSRASSVMLTRMDAATATEDLRAARKGKRRHKTAIAWQKALQQAKREAKAVRMEEARRQKVKGSVLAYENECGVRSFRCEHD